MMIYKHPVKMGGVCITVIKLNTGNPLTPLGERSQTAVCPSSGVEFVIFLIVEQIYSISLKSQTHQETDADHVEVPSLDHSHQKIRQT